MKLLEATKNGGGRGIFRIVEFINPSEATAYRVTGWTLDGKRIRENFKDHGEAVARKSELEIQAANLESAARPVVTRLTPEQAAQAEAAFNTLDGKPLMEAIRYYLDNYREPVRKITVKDGFAQFIKEREAANLRPLSLKNLRAKTSELLRECGDRILGDIGADTLRGMIFKPTRGPKAKDNYRRAIHAFFRWAQTQGYAAENPAAKITPIKADRQEPAIMTPQEAEALLTAAAGFKEGTLVPYVAIALFAGLRPTELARMKWDRIDQKGKVITIGSDVAKMRSKRLVAMSGNLVAWLAPYAIRRKPIVGPNWRRDFDVVKEAAGWGGRAGEEEREAPKLREWPQDIMRHTAITYHFAKSQHEGKTAIWAGNSPDIIQRHYKGLAKPAEARKFWRIKPLAKGKIIALRPAQALARAVAAG